jgi:hypothetical protein
MHCCSKCSVSRRTCDGWPHEGLLFKLIFCHVSSAPRSFTLLFLPEPFQTPNGAPAPPPPLLPPRTAAPPAAAAQRLRSRTTMRAHPENHDSLRVDRGVGVSICDCRFTGWFVVWKWSVLREYRSMPLFTRCRVRTGIVLLLQRNGL